MTDLKVLNARSNRITSLPVGLFTLSGLDELDLSENLLSDLDSKIGDLRSLRHLYLSGNLLEEFPVEICDLPLLDSLSLSSNLISQVPDDFLRLAHLDQLWLYDNPLVSPPVQVAASGLASLRAYLSARSKGLVDLKRRRRLLLVGPKDAGKTTLLSRLQTGLFNDKNVDTLGVDIQEGVEVGGWRGDVWDFGGDSHLYAAHRLFIDGNSIVVLIGDRAQPDEIITWLDMLSDVRGDESVVLVLNKLDLAPARALDTRELMATFPCLRTVVDTSCKTGGGFTDLEKAIIDTDRALVQSEQVPASWFAALQWMSNSNRFIVDYGEFDQVMVNRGGCADGTELKAARNALEAAGAVLVLRSTSPKSIAVDVEGVARAVYGLMSSPDVLLSGGIMSTDRVTALFVEGGVPLSETVSLVAACEAYGYIVRKVGDSLLIPDRMPQAPAGPLPKVPVEAIEFRLLTSRDPVYLLCRAFGRLGHLLQFPGTWGRGAVLASQDGASRGIIRADRLEGHLNVAVWGANRMSLAGFLRECLFEVAAAHGATVLEQVQLRSGHYVDRNEAVGQYLMGERTMTIGTLGMRVDLRQVLFGVSEVESIMNGPIFNIDRSAFTFGSGDASVSNGSSDVKSTAAALIAALRELETEDASVLADEVAEAALELNEPRLRTLAPEALSLAGDVASVGTAVAAMLAALHVI